MAKSAPVLGPTEVQRLVAAYRADPDGTVRASTPIEDIFGYHFNQRRVTNPVQLLHLMGEVTHLGWGEPITVTVRMPYSFSDELHMQVLEKMGWYVAKGALKNEWRLSSAPFEHR